MYGEKVEEAEELRLDLQDVKEMYKIQIQELMRNNWSSFFKIWIIFGKINQKSIFYFVIFTIIKYIRLLFSITVIIWNVNVFLDFIENIY